MTNRDAVPSLTAAQIEAGWHQTFSTSNPFCPCDLKSFTKAVKWAEWALRAPTAEQADAVRADQSPTVTLTGAQLLEAFQFVAPDHPNDADQLECEVTIQYGDGHDGPGLYCWFTEYPDEGAIRLGAPASSTGDQA